MYSGQNLIVDHRSQVKKKLLKFDAFKLEII